MTISFLINYNLIITRKGLELIRKKRLHHLKNFIVFIKYKTIYNKIVITNRAAKEIQKVACHE